MCLNRFKHIIIIGYGVVTGKVLKTANEKSSEWNYSLEYVEHEVHPFNLAKKYAESEGIEYHVIEDKKELTEFFTSRCDRKTLIISASNNYIFPIDLITNKNITIINFHNALLPDLPGRNAPSWAIYEGKTFTGITWHYVTAGVDAGDIIIQKQCGIGENTRAYELVAEQMKLATEAFAECFEDVLKGTANTQKQEILPDRRLYKSYEIPANGMFSLDDQVEDIYRLLRSMDYGKNDIFPLPITEIEGQKVQVRRYKIVNKADESELKYRLYIPINDSTSLMLKYDILMADGKVGGGVDDLEYLYQLVDELKKIKRRLVSNMLLSENELNELIKADKLYYEYKPEQYLNVWYEEWDFIRLYFYTASLDCYQPPMICNKRLICDLFFLKTNELNDVLIKMLQKQGFEKYAQYHRWIRKSKDADKNYVIQSAVKPGCHDGFYQLLKENFDVYSDFVPELGVSKSFLESKTCYSIINEKEMVVVGGIVITERGDMQTEEFVFVNPNVRGKGMARDLHKFWYKQNKNAKVRYIAWVRDNNTASEHLHLKFGYEKQEVYKITMSKGV